MNNTLNQFFKYVLVGAVAFVVDFGLLYILTDFLKIYYLLSASISFVFGLVANYFLSTKWVFGEGCFEDKKKESL